MKTVYEPPNHVRRIQLLESALEIVARGKHSLLKLEPTFQMYAVLLSFWEPLGMHTNVVIHQFIYTEEVGDRIRDASKKRHWCILPTAEWG